MKYKAAVLFTFFICALIILCGTQACNKCKTTNKGRAYLPDTSLNWISYANTQVILRNETGDSAIFNYSPLEEAFSTISHPVDPWNPCDQTAYDCQSLKTVLSSSLPYEFTVKLYTSQPGFPGSFTFRFSQGAYVFFYVIADTSNSVSSNFVHYNQVILNGITFSDVFADSHPSSLAQLYINKQLGLVGFVTTSGETWAVQL